MSEKAQGENLGTGYLSDDARVAPEQDTFGRYPFAAALARSIANRRDEDCLSIGLYAPWGVGKTTVLHFLTHALAEDTRVVVLSFNPWRYSSEDTLLQEFYSAFAKALGQEVKTTSERMAGVATDLIKDAGALGETVKAAVGPLGDIFSRLAKGHSDVDVKEAKARVHKFLKDEGRRVVVLIDDVDRLEAAEVHALLRLIRLNADFPRTTYVLACDPEMVAAALGQRFGADPAAGRSFLEKIIQVPLRLPSADPSSILRLWTEGLVDAWMLAGLTLDADTARRLQEGFVVGLWPEVDTPRTAKRLINTAQFALSLTKGMVNPADIVLLDGIRLLYPQVYQVLHRSRDCLLGSKGNFDLRDASTRKKANAQLYDVLLSSVDGDKRAALEKLLAILFPYTEALTDNLSEPTPDRDEWLKAKRVCTSEYFERHFSMGIPEGDISDELVAELSKLLAKGEIAGSQAWYDQFGTTVNGALILRKLDQHLDELGDSEAAQVARSLAAIGHRFSSTPETILPGPRWFSAGRVSTLLRRIADPDARFLAAQTTLAEPTDVGFAAEVLSNLATHDEQRRDRAPFTVSQESQLRTALVARLKVAGEDGSSVSSAALEPLLLGWARLEGKGAVSKWLAEAQECRPELLEEVLLAFAGNPWEPESGKTGKSLDRQRFERLSEALDSEVLGRLIREQYGSSLRVDEHADEAGDVEGVAGKVLFFLQLGLGAGDPLLRADDDEPGIGEAGASERSE